MLVISLNIGSVFYIRIDEYLLANKATFKINIIITIKCNSNQNLSKVRIHQKS